MSNCVSSGSGCDDEAGDRSAGDVSGWERKCKSSRVACKVSREVFRRGVREESVMREVISVDMIADDDS